MKEIIIHVEDSAYEKFMGMLSLCPQVEVVSEGVAIETREAIDLCVARAIREMRADGAFRFPSDYTYLMIAANEGQAKGMSFFHSPKEYLDYLKELELDGLPGRCFGQSYFSYCGIKNITLTLHRQSVRKEVDSVH